MSGDSKVELSEWLSDRDSEPLSGSSEASICSANEDFPCYNDSESYRHDNGALITTIMVAQKLPEMQSEKKVFTCSDSIMV